MHDSVLERSPPNEASQTKQGHPVHHHRITNHPNDIDKLRPSRNSLSRNHYHNKIDNEIERDDRAHRFDEKAEGQSGGCRSTSDETNGWTAGVKDEDKNDDNDD